jgi:hypothetical protein
METLGHNSRCPGGDSNRAHPECNYRALPLLHNEELHNLYSSPNRMFKSRRMRLAGHVARTGEKRNIYRVLVGRPEEKRPLGRPRRRWVENIKIDLTRDRMEWYGLDRYGSG